MRCSSSSLLPLALALPVCLSARPLADHGDTPLLIEEARHDARLTDFFAFERDGDLVLIVCTNPTIPPGVANYSFPPDLKFEVHVDNDSEVRFDDPEDLETYGGTIVKPKKIQADVRFRVRFDDDGAPVLQASGLPNGALSQVQIFAGLRDDPFIRGPRIGRNVAAIVLQMPMELVKHGQDELLLWATVQAPGLSGPFQELGGRSLRSMFPENTAMNSLDPKHHAQALGVAPDVVIFDTADAASFPNGRELTDDVVDLVGDPRVLMDDFPFPSENDVPFLDAFPWLAPPQ